MKSYTEALELSPSYREDKLENRKRIVRQFAERVDELHSTVKHQATQIGLSFTKVARNMELTPDSEVPHHDNVERFKLCQQQHHDARMGFNNVFELAYSAARSKDNTELTRFHQVVRGAKLNFFD